jgi:hypothetical protein
MNNTLAKRESHNEELNKLVESMQKEGENLKANLQVVEDGDIALSGSLVETKK